MRALSLSVVLLALVLNLSTVSGQEDGEEGGYGGGGYGEGDGGKGGGMGGYGEVGGGGGGAEPPPPAETADLGSVEEFEAFIDNADASIIGAFTAKEIVDPEATMPEDWDADEDGEWAAETIGNPALVEFNAVASELYGYRFATTTSPEVLEKLKSKTGGLYLYRSPKFLSLEHGDRPRERFPSSKFVASTVSSWVSSKAQPLVGQFSHTTKDRYTSAVLVIFMNLDFDNNGQSVNYVLKRARKAAVGLKGKLSIAVASLSEMSHTLSDFGLVSNKPTADILMGIRSGSDHFTSAAASFTASSLSTFAASYVAGELSPYVKPDEPYEPPADDADGASEEDDKEEM